MNNGRKPGALAAPALVVVVAGLAGPVAPAGAAQADRDWPPAAYDGDLTNDGILDHFAIVAGAPCAVKVEPGLGGGAYGPAVYHHFYTEPYGPGSTYCPDLAAVVDLGGDGVNDLVLAWFDSNIGVPWEGDILVLRNLQKVAVLRGMTFPSFLKTADLNGDGLTDVYEDYGDDEPFVSYLNTPSGDLVLGPLQGPCSQADYHLADYNENGKLDLLVGHYSGCDWQGRSEWGATVILDDGTRVPVYDGDSAPGSEGRWWVGDPVDHNGDGHLDVVAVDGDTHEVVKAYRGDGRGHFSAK